MSSYFDWANDCFRVMIEEAGLSAVSDARLDQVPQLHEFAARFCDTVCGWAEQVRGHTIAARRQKAAELAARILDRPRPTTVRDLYRFIGFAHEWGHSLARSSGGDPQFRPRRRGMWTSNPQSSAAEADLSWFRKIAEGN